MRLNNRIRTKVLLGILLLVGLFEFLDVITSSITLFYINQILNGVESDYAWFNFIESYEGFSQVVVLFLFLLGVVFLCWIYKAHQNLEILGKKDLKFSHLSAVWWWFVPIFWLWKPYQILKELLLKTTEHLKDKRIQTVSKLLLVYWLINVPLTIYEYFVFKYFYKNMLFSKVELYLSDYQFIYINSVITNVLGLILTGCLFYFVKQVNYWQQNSHPIVSLQKNNLN